MIDNYPKPEVGMEVFVVKPGYRKPYIATVTKVGRLWATLDGRNGRFGINTWRLDGRAGYSSPGTVYPSEQEYNTQQELLKTWSEFRKKVQYQSMNDSVTVEKIRQAAAILGVELL